MDEQEAIWHKRAAVGLYNRCWDLMDAETRSADETEEMLRAAFTSRHHWGVVGGPVEAATGDWQIARAASSAGFGDLALTYAQRALAAVRASDEMPSFMLASALEGVARAQAARGDAAGRDASLSEARAALDQIGDADERAEIERQICTVPEA